uniref:Uncharacterized protein n=1 Tax=Alexandrium monilatum TaxID=311494 RepID=A0A7S4Q379_9DINO|mmetsp:Transcript_16102/g.48495  ORF Transcript_16102/g.48495 Transcript_16102/m.48495 type:complete len:479 (+) Transcript_16102:147-1583(+)
MVGLATVCGVDLIARHLIEYGASVGFKLLRAGALSGFSSQEIYDTAIVGVRSTVPPVPSQASGLSWAEAKMLTLERDSADEVLVRLLPGANPDVLLSAAAARNFGTTCALLAERGADIHFVEVRRGRRRGLVDMAARAAGLDGDWRLVAWLLRCGARPEAPTGVIFSPLRRGEISLARQLVQLGVRPCKSGLVSLLCDVCAHGATEAAAMLIDELDVPVNALNARDGDSCTDRALAWHCWDTAEWLVVAKGGIPAKPDSALGHLLDASGDPVAARVLGVMRAKGLLGTHSLLEAAVQRGDLALVEELLAASPSAGRSPPASPGRGSRQLPLVDLALCHGHLYVAAALLRHGLRAHDPARARADVSLHAGGSRHRAAAEILALLPPAPPAEPMLPAPASGCWSSTFGHGYVEPEDDSTPAFSTASGDTVFGVFEGLLPPEHAKPSGAAIAAHQAPVASLAFPSSGQELALPQRLTDRRH